MRNTPKFIKEFSRKESKEERQETANTIRKKRSEYFNKKKTSQEGQSQVKALSQEIQEKEKVVALKLEELRKLQFELMKINYSFLPKLINYFKIKKLRADIAVGERTYDMFKKGLESRISLKEGILTKLQTEDEIPDMGEVKDVLDNFYVNQEKKWAESEYSREEIQEFFTEDNLASLSLNDYIILLKRFPREMVAHVTRQGIRDHVGLMDHTAGQGDFANGFINMVQDGRLRSPLGVYLMEEEKEKAIAKFLSSNNITNKDDAQEFLDKLTNPVQRESGGYSDKMAIHFATEEVADRYYGSEKGNEIFISYPSAFIASQYHFSSQLNKAEGGYWNDQWVWANEEKGMDLNAGVIFIPAETKVDKKTGSRYELDENKNPQENIEYHDAMRKFVDLKEFDEMAKQALEVLSNASRKASKVDVREILEPFCQIIKQKTGINDKRFYYAILDKLFDISLWKEEEQAGHADQIHSLDIAIAGALKDKGIYFMESSNSISSKDFWEDYFDKNPDKRPSKIVYYQGFDPTAALMRWREENGLAKTAADESIGFADRKVRIDSKIATSGIDRFRSLAQAVIDKHYA